MCLLVHELLRPGIFAYIANVVENEGKVETKENHMDNLEISLAARIGPFTLLQHQSAWWG